MDIGDYSRTVSDMTVKYGTQIAIQTLETMANRLEQNPHIDPVAFLRQCANQLKETDQ